MNKKSLLLTKSMCIDILSTYELQNKKEVQQFEYLFLSICEYVTNRKTTYLKFLNNENKRFFVTKVKNIIDEENYNHVEKSKKRMIIADEKRKEEDKKNKKENKYKINFDKIKPITKILLYKDDLYFIWKQVYDYVSKKNDIHSSDIFLLIFSLLNYFINGATPKTEEFLKSYVGLVFLDIKKAIDKHEQLYNQKIENKKAKND